MSSLHHSHSSVGKYYPNKSQWALSHFETSSTSSADASRACQVLVDGVLCGASFGSKTSASTLIYHLASAHKLTLPDYLKPKSDGKQTTLNLQHLKPLSSKPTLAEVKDRDQLNAALVFVMNPTMPFELLDDPYFRRHFSHHGLTRKNISSKIAELDRLVREMILERSRGKVVSCVFDGGKDICGRKLIASGIIIADKCLFWELKDTKLEALDANYFADYCSNLRNQLLANKTKLLSVTTDNEVSQVAGIRKFIAEVAPEVLHFRCGPHTLELFMKDIVDYFPGFKHAIKVAEKISHAFEHSKDLKKQFRDAQGPKPLNVVKLSNTRKWSSTFLVLSRLHRLKAFVNMVITANPDADIPAVNWDDLDAVRILLWPLYREEMILQRDRSNAIHLARSMYLIKKDVDSYVSHLRSRNFDDRAKDLEHSFNGHYSHYLSSGVGRLSQILWPVPDGLFTNDDVMAAQEELTKLVDKQFTFWTDNAKALGFVEPFVRPDMTVEERKQRFKSRAIVELQRHLIEPTEPIIEARRLFSEEYSRMCKEVELTERMPRPNPKRKRNTDEEQSSGGLVVHYWREVFAALPLLSFVVVGVLCKCSASEAAAERMFSKEGFIHDGHRNRLSPQVVDQLVRVGQNWAEYSGEIVVRNERDDDETEEDVEVIE